MITLRLDKNGGINKGDVQAFEHDNLSEVYIIQLYKNGAIYDLTNKNIELTMVERKRKIGDMVSLPIYNATEGKVKLEVVSDITKQDGIYDFKLTVKDTTGLIETFPSFQVKIENDITDHITGEIVQDKNFTILTEGLKALADYNIYKTNALKVPEIEQDIVEINEQLDTKANESEVNKRLSFRNFEPIFGYNCYWGEIWGTDGTHTQKNRVEIGNDIKHCEELGIDEITVDVHVGYNSNTSALYIATNMDDILWAISTFSDLNVKIKNAKIHVGILEDYLKNTITLPVFLSKYKNIVFEICDKLKNTTIENITVLNECSFIDTDTTYTTDVIELLNIAKNKGFKVGITCAGIEHNFNLPTTVIELSDLLCVNCYPTISFKKEKTTYEDSINAWKQHEVNMWIETRKKQYPNKKIIISETGVTNCWEALLSPASNVIDGTISNKATEVYLKGLFEVLNKDDLTSVWWWFGIFTEGTNIQKMFDYELRGIINE